MTKKHFIELADMIREHNRQVRAGLPHTEFADNQIEALASFCKSQNSNFNRERWISYINGECGPNGGDIK